MKVTKKIIGTFLALMGLVSINSAHADSLQDPSRIAPNRESRELEIGIETGYQYPTFNNFHNNPNISAGSADGDERFFTEVKLCESDASGDYECEESSGFFNWIANIKENDGVRFKVYFHNNAVDPYDNRGEDNPEVSEATNVRIGIDLDDVIDPNNADLFKPRGFIYADNNEYRINRDQGPSSSNQLRYNNATTLAPLPPFLPRLPVFPGFDPNSYPYNYSSYHLEQLRNIQSNFSNVSDGSAIRVATDDVNILPQESDLQLEIVPGSAGLFMGGDASPQTISIGNFGNGTQQITFDTETGPETINVTQNYDPDLNMIWLEFDRIPGCFRYSGFAFFEAKFVEPPEEPPVCTEIQTTSEEVEIDGQLGVKVSVDSITFENGNVPADAGLTWTDFGAGGKFYDAATNNELAVPPTGQLKTDRNTEVIYVGPSESVYVWVSDGSNSTYDDGDRSGSVNEYACSAEIAVPQEGPICEDLLVPDPTENSQLITMADGSTEQAFIIGDIRAIFSDNGQNIQVPDGTQIRFSTTDPNGFFTSKPLSSTIDYTNRGNEAELLYDFVTEQEFAYVGSGRITFEVLNADGTLARRYTMRAQASIDPGSLPGGISGPDLTPTPIGINPDDLQPVYTPGQINPDIFRTSQCRVSYDIGENECLDFDIAVEETDFSVDGDTVMSIDYQYSFSESLFPLGTRIKFETDDPNAFFIAFVPNYIDYPTPTNIGNDPDPVMITPSITFAYVGSGNITAYLVDEDGNKIEKQSGGFCEDIYNFPICEEIRVNGNNPVYSDVRTDFTAASVDTNGNGFPGKITYEVEPGYGVFTTEICPELGEPSPAPMEQDWTASGADLAMAVQSGTVSPQAVAQMAALPNKYSLIPAYQYGTIVPAIAEDSVAQAKYDYSAVKQLSNNIQYLNEYQKKTAQFESYNAPLKLDSYKPVSEQLNYSKAAKSLQTNDTVDLSKYLGSNVLGANLIAQQDFRTATGPGLTLGNTNGGLSTAEIAELMNNYYSAQPIVPVYTLDTVQPVNTLDTVDLDNGQDIYGNQVLPQAVPQATAPTAVAQDIELTYAYPDYSDLEVINPVGTIDDIIAEGLGDVIIDQNPTGATGNQVVFDNTDGSCPGTTTLTVEPGETVYFYGTGPNDDSNGEPVITISTGNTDVPECSIDIPLEPLPECAAMTFQAFDLENPDSAVECLANQPSRYRLTTEFFKEANGTDPFSEVSVNWSTTDPNGQFFLTEDGSALPGNGVINGPAELYYQGTGEVSAQLVEGDGMSIPANTICREAIAPCDNECATLEIISSNPQNPLPLGTDAELTVVGFDLEGNPLPDSTQITWTDTTDGTLAFGSQTDTDGVLGLIYAQTPVNFTGSQTAGSVSVSIPQDDPMYSAACVDELIVDEQPICTELSVQERAEDGSLQDLNTLAPGELYELTSSATYSEVNDNTVTYTTNSGVFLLPPNAQDGIIEDTVIAAYKALANDHMTGRLRSNNINDIDLPDLLINAVQTDTVTVEDGSTVLFVTYEDAVDSASGLSVTATGYEGTICDRDFPLERPDLVCEDLQVINHNEPQNPVPLSVLQPGETYVLAGAANYSDVLADRTVTYTSDSGVFFRIPSVTNANVPPSLAVDRDPNQPMSLATRTLINGYLTLIDDHLEDLETDTDLTGLGLPNLLEDNLVEGSITVQNGDFVIFRTYSDAEPTEMGLNVNATGFDNAACDIDFPLREEAGVCVDLRLEPADGEFDPDKELSVINIVGDFTEHDGEIEVEVNIGEVSKIPEGDEDENFDDRIVFSVEEIQASGGVLNFQYQADPDRNPNTPVEITAKGLGTPEGECEDTLTFEPEIPVCTDLEIITPDRPWRIDPDNDPEDNEQFFQIRVRTRPNGEAEELTYVWETTDGEWDNGDDEDETDGILSNTLTDFDEGTDVTVYALDENGNRVDNCEDEISVKTPEEPEIEKFVYVEDEVDDADDVINISDNDDYVTFVVTFNPGNVIRTATIIEASLNERGVDMIGSLGGRLSGQDKRMRINIQDGNDEYTILKTDSYIDDSDNNNPISDSEYDENGLDDLDDYEDEYECGNTDGFCIDGDFDQVVDDFFEGEPVKFRNLRDLDDDSLIIIKYQLENDSEIDPERCANLPAEDGCGEEFINDVEFEGWCDDDFGDGSGDCEDEDEPEDDDDEYDCYDEFQIDYCVPDDSDAPPSLSLDDLDDYDFICSDNSVQEYCEGLHDGDNSDSAECFEDFEDECGDIDNDGDLDECIEDFVTRTCEADDDDRDNAPPDYDGDDSAEVIVVCPYVLTRSGGDVFFHDALDTGVDVSQCSEVKGGTGGGVTPTPNPDVEAPSTGQGGEDSPILLDLPSHDVCRFSNLGENIEGYNDVLKNFSSTICELQAEVAETWTEQNINEAINANITRIARWGGNINNLPSTINNYSAFTTIGDQVSNGVFVRNEGDLTLSFDQQEIQATGSIPAAQTYIVIGHDLIIEEDINYGPTNFASPSTIPSAAFIVIDGNIIIRNNVSNIDGVVMAVDLYGNGNGKVTNGNEGVETDNILTINGNLIGDVSELFANRQAIGDPTKDEGSVTIKYDSRLLLNTPQGLNELVDVRQLEATP